MGGGGAPAPPELVRRVDRASARPPQHRLRHDRDQRLRPAEQRRRLPAQAHQHRPGHAHPAGRGRDAEGPLPDRRGGRDLVPGPQPHPRLLEPPEATAETIVDGWLRTGDIGRLDDEGFVYVEDRAKDMVLRGGENVYCAEVEAAIYEHPGGRGGARGGGGGGGAEGGGGARRGGGRGGAVGEGRAAWGGRSRTRGGGGAEARGACGSARAGEGGGGAGAREGAGGGGGRAEGRAWRGVAASYWRGALDLARLRPTKFQPITICSASGSPPSSTTAGGRRLECAQRRDPRPGRPAPRGPRLPPTATVPSSTTRACSKPAASGTTVGPPVVASSAPTRACGPRRRPRAANLAHEHRRHGGAEGERGQRGVVLERRRPVAGRLGLRHPQLDAVQAAGEARQGAPRRGPPRGRRSSG